MSSLNVSNIPSRCHRKVESQSKCPRTIKPGDVVEFLESTPSKYLRNHLAFIYGRPIIKLYSSLGYMYYTKRYFECLILTGKDKGKIKRFNIERLALKNLRVLTSEEINDLPDNLRSVLQRERISK
jgi:hypothetical protein